MNCRLCERHLLQQADGTIDLRTERQVRSHLMACPSCRKFSLDVPANRSALSEMAFLPPTADLTERTLKHLRVLRPQRSLASRRLLPALAAAAAVAILALPLLRTDPPRVPNRGKSNTPLAPPPMAKSHMDRSVPFRPTPKGSSAREIAAGNRPGPDNNSKVVTPAPRPTPHSLARQVPQPQNDIAYLNSHSVGDLAAWTDPNPDVIAALQADVDRSVHSADDFVRVEFPRIAGTGGTAVRAALAEYRRQKQTVDSRLARRVTLAVKGMSLEDLCKLLNQQTQVEMTVRRALADEKVTIFCKDLPLRNVMRGINRLFSFDWARVGEENAWRYELDQDLKSRLLEEELRSRDLNATLLLMDERMQKKAAESRAKGHTDPVAEIYANLSTSDRAALRNGQSLLFASKDAGDNPITPDLKRTLLKQIGKFRIGSDDKISFDDQSSGQWMYDLPSAYVEAGFRLAQTELGELTLQGAQSPRWTTANGIVTGMGNASGFGNPLLTVRSPAVEQPDNATINKALRREPSLQKLVTVATVSSCPQYDRDALADSIRDHRLPSTYEGSLETEHPVPTPHVLSGDVWEAVHKATGMPIIADYYTCLYPLGDMQTRQASTFDALCQVADHLGARWSYDSEGGCVLGKSMSWFWDKRKEIPNRLLTRWLTEKRRTGGLSLRTITEMANLSDAQLDSVVGLQALRHCQGLSELQLVGANSGGWRDFFVARRELLRALANASPETLRQVVTPEGIPFQALDIACRSKVLKALDYLVHAENLLPATLRIDYVPSGTYAWYPQGTHMNSQEDRVGPITHGKTENEAFAAAVKRYPAATRNAIHPSGGLLGITVITPTSGPEKATYWSFGKPIPGQE